MSSALYEAQMALAAKPTLTGTQRAREMESRGLAVNEGLVHVEVVAPEGTEAGTRVDVASFGGVLHGMYRNRVDAWMPPDRLIELATALPPGFVLERANTPQLDAVAGQGPGTTVINSAGYRDGGANGAGMTIAVIDGDWSGLTAARNNGDAPAAANTTIINYAGGSFEAGTTHGTGCLEAAFDHCPGATWRLYKVATPTDVGTAVTDAIANGVDVISHSLSWFNLGWADNTGAACAAANQASNAGILFVTSAGNRALDHWQGNFAPGTGDQNRHDWVNGDEALSLTVAPNSTATFTVSWNAAGGTFDYDVYLYDASMTTILSRSENPGNMFETVNWVNSSSNSVVVNLVVQRFSGGITEFEVFGNNNVSNYEYVVTAGSNTSPSNATGNLVLSVGAVPWNSYTQANGSNPIANYSSLGPSNSGMSPVPDLVGPTNTVGFTYPGGFGGTSCATPNVAGALCAFWSDKPAFSGLAVSWLAGEQARTWRDWGVPGSGSDNVYGAGPCRIVDFASGTSWVAKNYGNVANNSTGPYFTILAAHNAGALGGRLLIIPGGIYPENIVLNRAMRVETVGSPATIGQ